MILTIVTNSCFCLNVLAHQVSVSEVFKEVTLEMNVTEAVQQHLAQATSHIHSHKYPHRPGDKTLK